MSSCSLQQSCCVNSLRVGNGAEQVLNVFTSKFAGRDGVYSVIRSCSNNHVANVEVDGDLELAADRVVLGACGMWGDEAGVV